MHKDIYRSILLHTDPLLIAHENVLIKSYLTRHKILYPSRIYYFFEAHIVSSNQGGVSKTLMST